MHIHHATIGLGPISSYAAGSNRAAAAQQAAEVRKRLRKTIQSIAAETASDPDADFLVDQWLDSRPSLVLPGDEYHAAQDAGPDLL